MHLPFFAQEYILFPMGKAPEQHFLTISSLTKRGYGFSTLPRQEKQAQAVEVPFTLPGEEVTAWVFSHKKRGCFQSRLISLEKASSLRVIPHCSHFGACGGCQWQHMSYTEQLRVKEACIEENFSSLSHVPSPRQPILGCDPPWHYRNKMECTFSMDRQGNRYLGLMLVEGKGRVFSLCECHLVPSWFADAVIAVREWWQQTDLRAFHPTRRTGSLRYLTIREGKRTGERMMMITTSGDPDYAWRLVDKNSCIAHLAPLCDSLVLRLEQSQKGSKTQYYEMILAGKDHICEKLSIEEKPGEISFSLIYQIAPTAFFQPNTIQAEKIYSQALQMITLSRESIVYDLYCGTGTFSLCVAQKAKEVIGIELSHESVVDARENAKRNGLQNITFLQGDVGHILEERKGDLPAPDLVIVDPPRAGLDKAAIRALLRLAPPALLYVSCNPVTQAENLLILEKAGYFIAARQAIDQCPHTVHVENIVLLHKYSETDNGS